MSWEELKEIGRVKDCECEALNHKHVVFLLKNGQWTHLLSKAFNEACEEAGVLKQNDTKQ